LNDEFKINTATDTLKLGGDIYRSECRRRGDWLFILESLNVECLIDIFHVNDGIYFRLVLTQLPFVPKIQG
jgi:hypothetical protein